MSRQIRFSLAVATALLLSGTAGCAAPTSDVEPTAQITVAERERLASGIPQGWPADKHPESIARMINLHVVGRVVSIGKPVETDDVNGDYVPIRVFCMQGPCRGELTFRFFPVWDEADGILRLEVGQRVLLSGNHISEDSLGLTAITAYNIFLIEDDQTMKQLDSTGTVVGNLNDYRKQFGLD
ncbi:MAG: hypothetical protein NTX78_04005 [Rhodoluna sp.]|nr:hypothetical protein [Rhodoluna sp.]